MVLPSLFRLCLVPSKIESLGWNWYNVTEKLYVWQVDVMEKIVSLDLKHSLRISQPSHWLPRVPDSLVQLP